MATTAIDLSDIFQDCERCSRTIFGPFKRCLHKHVVCGSCGRHQRQHVGDGDDDIDPIDILIPPPKQKEDKCEGTERSDNEDEFRDKLYSILGSNEDYCSYNCGLHTNMKVLRDHEKLCTKRPKPARCYITPCQWTGLISELLAHVLELHFNQIVIYANNRMEDINISSSEPNKLMILFDNFYPSNELYWIRLHIQDDVKFFIIQHYGSIGLQMERGTLLHYNIKAREISIDSNIIQYEDSISRDISITEGTCISSLEGSDFKLKIMSNSGTNFINESIMKELECTVCTQIMCRPIIMCITGHSICEKCSQKVHKCPICQKCYKNTRNFALESISEHIETFCPHRDNGCMELLLSGDCAEHSTYCLFRKMECLYVNCDWKGQFCHILRHIEESHNNKIIQNGILTQSIYKGKPYYELVLPAFENLFVFAYGLYDGYIRFVVYYVPYNKHLNFEIELNILNNINKTVWSSVLPCIKIFSEFPDFLDVEIVSMIPKDFYEHICDELSGELRFILNVFKMP